MVTVTGEYLPAIPASAGALIFDRAGRLLILKPTYKSGWTIPGGVMEADGETPWEACRREVREECGIEVRRGRLACMDFRRPKPGRAGGIRFLFDCGRIDDQALAGIVVQPEGSPSTGSRPCPTPSACSAARSGGGSAPPAVGDATGWSTWRTAAWSPGFRVSGLVRRSGAPRRCRTPLSWSA